MTADEPVEGTDWPDGTIQLGQGIGVLWLTDGDLIWRHDCNGKAQWGHIDITSGRFHSLVCVDPLHIEASVICLHCGRHGFIRQGNWVPA